MKGGARAPLVNPSACGIYTSQAVLTSWSGKTIESDSSFTTSHDGQGEPCSAAQFNPTLRAGTVNPIAGAISPFVLNLTRSDGDPDLVIVLQG
jgi:hypothetical protein